MQTFTFWVLNNTEKLYLIEFMCKLADFGYIFEGIDTQNVQLCTIVNKCYYANMKQSNTKLSAHNQYIGHVSAAMLWKVPCLHVVFGYSNEEAFIREHSQLHRYYYGSAVPKKKHDEIRHKRSQTLPQNATCLMHGMKVASPELLFLDLANHLSFHQLVFLGMQLCSVSCDDKRQLTTKESLRHFLEKCSAHTGYKAAKNAVQYIADNSWSVMESLLYLMLTLPHKFGGYGLSGAVLNQSISLKHTVDWQKTNTVFADLCWCRAKTVVEYDSYEFHNTSDKWVRDARKSTALERDGYRTLSINTAQIYSNAALADAAHVISGYLGKRMQIRASQFEEQKHRLRKLLPQRVTNIEHSVP